jgi:hypothetical protein
MAIGKGVVMPTIEKIEYRKLVSTGDYSNITIGATAEVHYTETPEVALQALTAWVDEQLHAQTHSLADMANAETKLWRIKQDINAQQEKLYRARDKYEQMRKVLAANGIELPPCVQGEWTPEQEVNDPFSN